MIVQFSRGGGQFLAGKYVGNQEPDKASVAGCVAGALQVRQLAEFYGVPVRVRRPWNGRSLGARGIGRANTLSQ